MPVITEKFNIKTKGFTDIIDITENVKTVIKKHNPSNANITVYVAGSTASISTMEYEPGLLKDIPEAYEKIAPINKNYHHDETWHDGNGYAHVRASLTGNSQCFPVQNHEIILGTWQQIILLDFDNKPRTRSIFVQIVF
ncbi:MAG: secondary thiamine-phosphate synthase enzyme YjbQ [bacterium]